MIVVNIQEIKSAEAETLRVMGGEPFDVVKIKTKSGTDEVRLFVLAGKGQSVADAVNYSIGKTPMRAPYPDREPDLSARFDGEEITMTLSGWKSDVVDWVIEEWRVDEMKIFGAVVDFYSLPPTVQGILRNKVDNLDWEAM